MQIPNIKTFIYHRSFCITFVFHFSWVLQPSQETLTKNAYAIFFSWGAEGGGRLISLIIGNVEVGYGRIALAVATLGPLIAFSGSGIFLI